MRCICGVSVALSAVALSTACDLLHIRRRKPRLPRQKRSTLRICSVSLLAVVDEHRCWMRSALCQVLLVVRSRFACSSSSAISIVLHSSRLEVIIVATLESGDQRLGLYLEDVMRSIRMAVERSCMSRHSTKHGARHSLWGGVAVFVVIALTGFLLSTNVRVNRTVAVTNDTADLVEQGVDEVNQLQQDVSDLTEQVANLTDALKADGTDGTDSTQNQGKDSSNVDSSLMLPALSGSGVTVTLDDSPLWENAVNNNGTTANINDYVIHQQDVESVVNALWAGGADALMIMDQRVLFNSAVICSGNVLSLHGKKYSPPFTISAIGDPQRLRAALNDSEAITILKQYVTAFGIGYKVENAEDLQFPATAALLQQLKYATVDTSKTTDEEQTQQ